MEAGGRPVKRGHIEGEFAHATSETSFEIQPVDVTGISDRKAWICFYRVHRGLGNCTVSSLRGPDTCYCNFVCLRTESREVRRRHANAEAGGGAERMKRQHTEGKLSARERIDLLLDEGTFEEMDKLVRHRTTDFGMAQQVVDGDGFVTGTGTFMGVSLTCSRRISPCWADRCRKPTR